MIYCWEIQNKLAVLLPSTTPCEVSLTDLGMRKKARGGSASETKLKIDIPACWLTSLTGHFIPT